MGSQDVAEQLGEAGALLLFAAEDCDAFAVLAQAASARSGIPPRIGSCARRSAQNFVAISIIAKLMTMQ